MLPFALYKSYLFNHEVLFSICIFVTVIIILQLVFEYIIVTTRNIKEFVSRDLTYDNPYYFQTN